MNRTFAALTTAAVIAVAPLAASAQGMGAGYDMLLAALVDDFERIGVEMDQAAMDALTLGELAAIKNIVESEESDNNKKGQIEAIIAD